MFILVIASICSAGKNASAAEIEVPGLITDHTVTSIGHAFYRDFSDNWGKEYPGTLTINERPSARWEVGSLSKLNRIRFIKRFISKQTQL